jgi:hypothetical protein
MTTPAKRRARRARRGAAMTEAVVAIPFFILAFAGIVFIGDFYKEKLRTLRESRSRAWTHASNGCSDNAAETDPNAPTTVPPGQNNPGQGAPGSSVLTQGYDESHATVTGSATASNILGGTTKNVKSESFVTCNEQPHDGDIVGVFKYVGDVISDVSP